MPVKLWPVCAISYLSSGPSVRSLPAMLWSTRSTRHWKLRILWTKKRIDITNFAGLPFLCCVFFLPNLPHRNVGHFFIKCLIKILAVLNYKYGIGLPPTTGSDPWRIEIGLSAMVLLPGFLFPQEVHHNRQQHRLNRSNFE